MSKIFFPTVGFYLTLVIAPTIADAGENATSDATITPEQAAFFETKIRPVLIDRCQDCHSGDEPENGLNLESRAGMLKGGKLGTALVPGKPAQSLLVSAIKHDEFIKMPPKEKLPERVIAGSHRNGTLSTDQMESVRENHPEMTCLVRRGGVLVMRPLLLHASSKSTTTAPRRVLHFLFGPTQLPCGLAWRRTV